MADNTAQNGTALIATDEITQLNGVTVPAVQAQLIKPVFGGDGVAQFVTPTNGLPVVQVANSLVSTANSSAAAQAANGVFTGTAEDVSEYSTVMVNVFADQASAVDGLRIEQSSNGTNWDISDLYSIPINSGKPFSVGVVAKFFRVVYTNGATASTALRLQTIYSKESKKNSSQRPQDGRTNDNDMEEGITFPMVYNGPSWDRLRGTAATGMTVNGTFFQATQPVSGAFFQATQPVSIAATVAVSGAFFQATQPVSLATNTPTLATGANVIGSLVGNQSVITSDIRASTLHVTATAAVNTAITASLPAPAAGLFHYITSVQLVKVYNALGVAAGAGVVITSSNLPGSPAWLTEQAAGAVGTAVTVINYQPTTPLKAALAATATTFVAPAQLQTIWRWNVSYFTAA